jgi:hypothetical protein
MKTARMFRIVGMAVGLVLTVVAGQAGGATYYVDANGFADFTTIQAAIDASSNDDEIEVAPGTYNEAINFSGKAVTLRSSDPNDPNVVATTIIDATGMASSVVICAGGEGPNTILAGFTITGGSAAYGGGMSCVDSSPTVTDCNFTGNTASSGGGMHNNNNSSPSVTDCDFTNNTATNLGGGILNYSGSNPIVTNCTFNDNSAETRGGGMCNENYSDPCLTNCTFTGNFAAWGGGMCNYIDCQPTVANCTFNYNMAGSNGGGMYNRDYSSPTVINCTFAGNTATYGSGGMYNYISSSPTVTNSIFWGNSPAQIVDAADGSSSFVTYSDIQGGWGGAGDNNIDDDPLFVNAANNDLRLRACSPCVDAGNNNAVPVDVNTDLAGNPRFMDDADVADTGSGPPPHRGHGGL